MRKYVLIVSEQFPVGHCAEGRDTHFVAKIEIQEKIHTIRLNYDLGTRVLGQVSLRMLRKAMNQLGYEIVKK